MQQLSSAMTRGLLTQVADEEGGRPHQRHHYVLLHLDIVGDLYQPGFT